MIPCALCASVLLGMQLGAQRSCLQWVVPGGQLTEFTGLGRAGQGTLLLERLLLYSAPLALECFILSKVSGCLEEHKQGKRE